MALTQQPKKSETIEVRLSHEAKAAFMQRCHEDQRTASDVIRLFIDGRIGPKPEPRPKARLQWRAVAAIAAGAALGMGAAAPSLAHAAQTSRLAFDQLDRNHDGVVSYEEFRDR